MSKKVKVSVIVPVFNVEKYIEKCLDSLVEQTLDSYEVIVVDDGSTDTSPNIVKKYEQKYPEIIKAYHQENKGLGSARNLGLQHAQGEYIGFVDSDDWVDSKCFEILYNKAAKENLDILIFDFMCVYDGWEQGWVARGFRGGENDRIKEDYILYGLDPATACNKLFKADLFYITRFPEIWYEDVATTPILTSYATNINYIELPLYYYRQRSTSIIHSVKNPKTLDILLAWDYVINNIKKEFYDSAIRAVYYSIVNFMTFKPEYADEFLKYAKKNADIFKNNPYIKSDIANGLVENILIKKLIPKKIHYFWFGGGEKSELIKKCMKSWKKFASDFEIIEWNETNCNINECDYVREAYENKKWAFVADYFRTKIIYEEGGFYLDTDIELMSNIDSLRLNKVFFGFETKTAVNAAIFGAVPKNKLVKLWYNTYQTDHLVGRDGKLNTSNTIVVRLTKLLNKRGIEYNAKTQVLKDDIKIYAPNILTINIYDNKCIAQHHYEASWWDVNEGMTSYKHEVLKDYFSVPTLSITEVERNSYELLLEELSQIKNSGCWKITKPYRFIASRLRKKYRN